MQQFVYSRERAGLNVHSVVQNSMHYPPPAVVLSASGDRLFTVGSPGSKFQAGGAEFTYNVRAKAGNFTETLTAYGPLNESITIEVHTSLCEILMYAFTVVIQDVVYGHLSKLRLRVVARHAHV